MNRPTIEIVGTPDLPEVVREMFPEAAHVHLRDAHRKISTPDGHLIGYMIYLRVDDTIIVSSVLRHDRVEDGFFEDVRHLATKDDDVPETVPCRRDYCVCPDCLREIRGVVHVIEGESPEDRPHPSIDDAWDRVEGNGGLCGGDHCANPPQLVVWTRQDGEQSARQFASTMDASMTISGMVQWDPAIVERCTAENLTPDEIIDAYESADVRSIGEFLRLDLDPQTGEPVLPGVGLVLFRTEPRIIRAEVEYKGVAFTIERVDGNLQLAPKTSLPEPPTIWS